MPNPLRMSFARLCRETRVMLDITQEELATVVGVSRSYIAGIEAGKVKPVIDSTFPLADAEQAHLRLQSGQHAGKGVLVA